MMDEVNELLTELLGCQITDYSSSRSVSPVYLRAGDTRPAGFSTGSVITTGKILIAGSIQGLKEKLLLLKQLQNNSK